MTPAKTWRLWLVGLILGLWGLQVLWLIWHFGPEARDLAQRAARGSLGSAIRQEEPLYRWATALQAIIPESATYVFLDDYAAGKEIEVRYYLAPRRHILLSPGSSRQLPLLCPAPGAGRLSAHQGVPEASGARGPGRPPLPRLPAGKSPGAGTDLPG